MIITDPIEKTLDIPHLGLTLRSIMGAADTAARDMDTYQRKWKLLYKGAIIGNIQLASGERTK